MIRKLIGPTVAATLAVASSAGAVTLNPPPPQFYACVTNGSGTVCHGKHSGSYQSFDGHCPQGFDILENGFVEETAKRVYDRDGNLVQRVLHDRWPLSEKNILYNSVTGTSVRYLTDVNEFDTFAVPGDFGSVTATFDGVGYVVTARGGLLAHDSGVLVFAPDGSLIDSHGPHTLFDGQIDALCAALA